MSALDLLRALRDLPQREDLGGTDKLVVVALILRCDSTRLECWPSHATLARDCWLGERTVRDALRRLEASGLIVVRRRTTEGNAERDTNVYRVDLDKVRQQPPEVRQQPPHVGQQPPGGTAATAVQVRQLPPGGGAAAAEEVPNEVSIGSAHGRERGRAADAATPQPARRRTPRAPNGTRLPADWTPSAAVVAWATGKGIDHTPAVEAFRDHWLASSLPSAVKRDWDAAFRTWLRRDLDAGKAMRLPPTPTPRPQAPALTPEERQQSARIVREALEQFEASIAAGAIP